VRINFVSYLHPEYYHGGGELDNLALIISGRKLGHDIKIAARRTGKLSKFFTPRKELHLNPHLWLLSDVWNCPDQRTPFDEAFIRSIVEDAAFVHIDNAYVDICSRSGLPCNGAIGSCPAECDLQRAHWLYSRSRKNFFLSPLHLRVVNGMLGNRYLEKAAWLRPLIDVSRFVNKHQKRDIEYLYVGTISDYRGYQNIKNRFGNQKDFLFVGPSLLDEPVFGRHVPNVPHDRINELYNRAVNYVHLPKWIEPMGRVVVEAALCGAQIIGNENVGALSFPFSISEPNNMINSGLLFWEEAGRVL